MSIEIEVLNGGESSSMAKTLFDMVWPPDVVAKTPWAGIVFADADLRVLVQVEGEGLVCHVSIFRREAKWNGRKIQVGGIGGVATREDLRRRGYASVALNAAIQTLKDEGATDFALLFCEPGNVPFYVERGWKPFAGEIYADQPAGRGRFDAIAPLVFDLNGRAPLQGTIDLCGLPW